MATLNLAELYQQALVQKYTDEMKFVSLWNTSNNSIIKWAGAKTIHIPSITVQGAKDVSRDTISAFGRNVDNNYQTKTLQHDREFDTLVDPQDVDETNLAITVANITNVFNTEQKIPELDKYMISKLYSEAVRLGNTIDATAIDATNAYDLFDNFMANMDEGEVPDNGRILYVTTDVHKALKDSNKLTHFMDASQTGGVVNRAPLSLDGVPVIVVPTARMKSLYNFTSGAVADGTAKQVNMMLIHPSSMVAPMKYEYVDMAAPSAQSKGKFLYYERFYCDVFALDNRASGIQINAI